MVPICRRLNRCINNAATKPPKQISFVRRFVLGSGEPSCVFRIFELHPVPLTASKECTMAFPPNYNQERKSREAAKHRKAQEKQMKREEKSALRKHEQDEAHSPAPPDESKREV
jgi:hypothetical protein